jgi:hypothetical protein
MPEMRSDRISKLFYNEPMLKEVAVLKHKTMNEAIQFDNRKMFERSGEPAISFKHLLAAAASTGVQSKHKKFL